MDGQRGLLRNFAKTTLGPKRLIAAWMILFLLSCLPYLAYGGTAVGQNGSIRKPRRQEGAKLLNLGAAKK